VRKKKAKARVTVATWIPSRPDALGPAASSVVSSPPLATAGTGSPSLLVPLVLAVAALIAVLTCGLALLPPRALPRQVVLMVYDRRDAMITGGLAMAGAMFIGIAITLLSR
jgi:hypothetical protein